MRLSEFIRTNMPVIINEWMIFATSITPVAGSMSQLQLKDHIEQILSFIATDIQSMQSDREQVVKSHGKGDDIAGRKDTASETHGGMRQADGFDIVQMVSEYRALRASIIKLWSASDGSFTQGDLLDLTRFNESIDQSLAESVARFMKQVDYSKDLLLGILGHDIRSPLGAITMLARMLPTLGELNEKQKAFVSQIESSGERITNIVTDLLDLTRARLGTGLPVNRQEISLHPLAEQIALEMRVQHPDRQIFVQTSGNSNGQWDVTRLGQAFSNLIGNAIQYGSAGEPVKVIVKGQPQQVEIVINNAGIPIPQAQLPTLFNSFTRGSDVTKEPTDVSSNLGLGLFITREIIHSHGGTISVTSNSVEGTTFSIILPNIPEA
jgi:signal transduction histidine kinase